MPLPESIRRAPFWTWLSLVDIALVSLIDLIRDTSPPPHPPWVGSAPSFFAVVALCFGWMMVRLPEPHRHPERNPAPLFRQGLIGATAGLLAWEIVQVTGNLVFDPRDLVATLLGSAACLLAYRIGTSRRRRTPGRAP